MQLKTRNKYEKMKIDSTPLRILALTVIAAAILGAEAAQGHYRFPSHCTCQYKKLGGGRNCRNPTCYPNSCDLGLEGDCLPPIPENHRLCYCVRVKKCRGDYVRPYRCSLFEGGLGMAMLPMTSNPNTVDIVSVNGTGFKTVCFYNVSLNNCSQVTLRHVLDQPADEYLDIIGNEEEVCHDGHSTCKDYLQLYNGEENQTFCREGLARLNMSLGVSSIFAVHWTDSIANPRGSFKVKVQCSLDSL